jgi:hypothetical protein
MKMIKGLKTITSKKLKRTLKVQKDLEWSYFSERELVENLVSQRFNYFIVAFSLFITAAATVESPVNLGIILGLGILVLSALWLTILNSYFWLDIVLRILHNLPIKDHMFMIIREERKARTYHFSVNRWIGIFIPLFCLIILIVGFILVLTGDLTSLKR